MNAKIFHGSFLLYPVTMMKGRGLVTEHLNIQEGSLQINRRGLQTDHLLSGTGETESSMIAVS